jgi:hypothetical protein
MALKGMNVDVLRRSSSDNKSYYRRRICGVLEVLIEPMECFDEDIETLVSIFIPAARKNVEGTV